MFTACVPKAFPLLSATGHVHGLRADGLSSCRRQRPCQGIGIRFGPVAFPPVSGHASPFKQVFSSHKATISDPIF
jgi:hypothetical protein